MPTTRTQQIAHIVRNARVEKGWKQTELAERVGVHVQTIGNLERASHQSQPDLLRKLEEVLDVDLSAASLAGQALIDVIVNELVEKMRDLGEARGLLMASETLAFINDWEVDQPSTQRRRASS